MRDLPRGSYLPAIAAEPAGMAPRQLFCAAQPLEP
jgi:hypothetical protein